MAYDTSNPPAAVFQRVGDAGYTAWWYVSTDPIATVRVNNYFSNGYDLGMRKGDIVFVTDSDSSPVATQICSVVEASSTAGIDISDGVAITATDSD